MVALRIAFLIFLAFIYQSSFLGYILPVDLLAMITFFYAGKKEGPFVATAAGLSEDMLLSVPLGTYGFSMTLASLLIVKIWENFTPKGKSLFLFLFLFLIFKDFLAFLVLKIFSYPGKFSFFADLVTLIFYIPVYLRYERES